jgi:hypothetical protein
MDRKYLLMVEESLAMSRRMDALQDDIVRSVRFLIKISTPYVSWKGGNRLSWDTGERLFIAEDGDLSWWAQYRSHTQIKCHIGNKVVCTVSMVQAPRIQGLTNAQRVRLSLPLLLEGVIRLIPETEKDVDRFRTTGTTKNI